MIPPGTVIDEYVVEAPLGAGGFGRVYKARARNGDLVALKLARTPIDRLSTVHLRLQQNELEALLELQHPGLVRVEGYGTYEDLLYIAMELVEGESLSSYLARRGRLDPLEATAFMASVADALAACHERGILHLDLKPEHVIVVDATAARIKIVDFGLALLEHTSSREQRRAAGTPEYMAPECFDEGTPDARADLYGVGVILYALLTGKLPFGIRSLPILRDAKRAGGYVPVRERVPGVPQAIAALTEQLLEPDPAARPRSAATVAEALRSLYFETLAGSGRASDDVITRVGPEVSASARFVGRWVELSVLRQAWARAEAGQPASVLMWGRAGLGKSRLLAEALEAEPRERGFVAYGRCRQVGGVVSYSPLREALGALAEQFQRLPPARQARLGAVVRSRLGSWAGIVVGLVPELAQSLPEARTQSPVSAGPLAVARAVAAVLGALASFAPVCIAIEDLHWADDAVLEVVRTLGELRVEGVLLVVTSRTPVELPSVFTPLELTPLHEPDHRALLRALIEGAQPTASASDELIARLQSVVPLLRVGNPLVAGQVVRHLVACGCLRRDAAGRPYIDEAELARYEAPDTVADVLERIADRLGEPSRRVLQVAALFGRHFSLIDLGQLFDRVSVGQAVLEAHRLGLCGVGGDRCSFGHDVIREQLANAVPFAERSQWHRRIAVLLERRRAPSAQLAHHLELAGKLTEAALQNLQAAEHADSSHDPRGAAIHLHRSIELAARVPRSPERDELVRTAAYELIRVAAQIGNVEDVLDRLRSVVALLGPGCEHDDAVVTSAFARVHYLRGDFIEAMEFSRRCLASTPVDGELSRYRVVPVNIEARVLCASGKFASAAEALLAGCELAEQHREYRELAQSLGMLGMAVGFSGDLAGARQYVDEGARLAEHLGDPVRMLGALFFASVMGEYAYDWKAGVVYSAEALRFADRHSLGGLYRYLALMFAGRHQFHVGQLERAKVLLESTLAMAEELGLGMGVGWALAFLGDVHFVEGRYEDALQCYDGGIGCANAGFGDEYSAPLCLLGRAHVNAMLGRDPLDVHADAAKALERLDQAGNRSARPAALQRYAEAMELLGAATQAASLRKAAAAAFADLETAPVDWWPQPPGGLAELGANPRAFWLARSAASRAPTSRERGPERERITAESLSPGAVETVSRAILQSLPERPDVLPLFAEP